MFRNLSLIAAVFAAATTVVLLATPVKAQGFGQRIYNHFGHRQPPVAPRYVAPPPTQQAPSFAYQYNYNNRPYYNGYSDGTGNCVLRGRC